MKLTMTDHDTYLAAIKMPGASDEDKNFLSMIASLIAANEDVKTFVWKRAEMIVDRINSQAPAPLRMASYETWRAADPCFQQFVKALRICEAKIAQARDAHKWYVMEDQIRRKALWHTMLVELLDASGWLGHPQTDLAAAKNTSRIMELIAADLKAAMTSGEPETE